MTGVFVGIGSNQEPERNLCLAVAALRQRYDGLRTSPVYRSPAVGFDGPDFLNLVAGFDTELGIEEVVAGLDSIETGQGRVRGPKRYCSRPVDVDLLLYGDECDPDGRYPATDIERYPFVLRPLADLCPDGRHPVTRQRFEDMWRRMVFAGPVVDVVGYPLDLGSC